MSVNINGHTPIGIACHEIKATCLLIECYLFFLFCFFVFMVSLVDHHGVPLMKTMVNHGLGPFT